ncbi:ras-related protein Rab-9B [Atheta coriaria]|uniref:ras-related protein Rab-9B n=1 Tax=Dalotia coriaria TaxID=877792 RepID=UPI0031F37E5C
MSGRVNMRPVSKNPLLKVVILGDGGVGKSCLMNRFVSNQFDENSFHTIGVEFLNKDIEINNNIYTLQIWDTAGQERFKTLRTPFYRGSDICLLTYAIDDQHTFKNLSMWMTEFLHYADIKESAQFPFIVVGNKSDVEAKEREVTKMQLETWCAENHVASCIETSAKNASNVQEAFHMAVEHWMKAERCADRQAENAELNDTVDLRKVNLDTRSSCCARNSE